MKISLPVAALVIALALALGSADFSPAEAGDWYVGGSFRVGGAHFSLAYDRAHRYDRSPYARPHHYYRTKHRLRYDGYRCGSHCFKRSRYSYHHATCPLVLHHFRRNRFHPARAWDYVKRPYPYHPDYYAERYYSHRGHRDYYGYDSDHDSDSDSDSH
jgi:hypothetical protein